MNIVIGAMVNIVISAMVNIVSVQRWPSSDCS
jgi:hypothetical protein